MYHMIYAPYSIFTDRTNGRATISERRPASNKPTKIQEEVIIQEILNLDSRGFAPLLACVEDMANCILEVRGGKCVMLGDVRRCVEQIPRCTAKRNSIKIPPRKRQKPT